MQESIYSRPPAPVRLADLLGLIGFLELSGPDPASLTAITITADSRESGPGSLFVAIRGFVADGHAFIDTAIRNGAVAVICETLPMHPVSGVLFILVADARKALAEAARVFYAYASDRLMLIGVTGTNGKTTTARLIAGMLNAGGIPAAYIGTGLCRIGSRDILLERTTPEAHELQALFFGMLEEGCVAAVMEVSSHALVLDRVYALRFRCGVFTNLSVDHLDFHHTLDEYARAKQFLFDQLEPDGFAVINSDDPYSAFMASRVPEDRRFCCSMQPDSREMLSCGKRFSVSVKERKVIGTMLELHFPDETSALQTELPGKYNAMNLLEAAAVGSGMGMTSGEVAEALRKPFSVPGRMERVWDEVTGRCGFVDYAHTPDALEKALCTLRELTTPPGRLVVVFGCGGNRDTTKRPLMGRIASDYADFVYITSDNPRNEDPETILDAIEQGISGVSYKRISCRADAIRQAVASLRSDDVLLVAGKGHETYQEIAGKKHYFSDQEMLRECFRDDRLTQG
ncbi:MAG: UDP-N-acetylmuramoyl-L-alanyl-D-glutamate--2,6-diaminopimelate ligase [Chlorobiaceae bacterium]|jgi:UDP-N-acetylmuramyl-tripeptide synthetase|nr:UDP-N-acetylmuramoyl-L-alanyl-D-glutamate--2,6-diaminopimelate ligase [Chlorobiaceae bacterium]